MEQYATKKGTIAFLLSLGFTEVCDTFYDSPGCDAHGSIVQVHIYLCSNGYYCVGQLPSPEGPGLQKPN